MKKDINHKNQILMNKLMAISAEKRKYGTSEPRRKLDSLNRVSRKLENERINKENGEFAKRLFLK
jgi:hypothetical protein